MKRKNINKKIDNLDDLERKKTFFMWFGVSFFMFLIVVTWFYSLKVNFAKYAKDDNIENDDFYFVNNDISQQLEEFKKELDKLNQIASSSQEQKTEQSSQDNNILDKKEIKIENSSSTASSTAE